MKNNRPAPMHHPTRRVLTLCALAAATFAQYFPVPDYFAPIEDQSGLPRVLLNHNDFITTR